MSNRAPNQTPTRGPSLTSAPSRTRGILRAVVFVLVLAAGQRPLEARGSR